MKFAFKIVVEPDSGMGLDTYDKIRYALWEAITDNGMDNAASVKIEQLSDDAELLSFVRSCAKDFDCDEDAHKYGTMCRCCEAERLLGTQ